MSKCLVNKKPLLREWTSCLNTKPVLKWDLNGLENLLEKKSDSKNWKKNRKKKWNCHRWTKNQLLECHLFQTTFSHSTLKLEQKLVTPQNHSPFSLHYLFRHELLHFEVKNHEYARTDLKKRQPSNTIQILWNVKKQEKAKNGLIYRCAAIKKRFLL